MEVAISVHYFFRTEEVRTRKRRKLWSLRHSRRRREAAIIP